MASLSADNALRLVSSLAGNAACSRAVLQGNKGASGDCTSWKPVMPFGSVPIFPLHCVSVVCVDDASSSLRQTGDWKEGPRSARSEETEKVDKTKKRPLVTPLPTNIPGLSGVAKSDAKADFRLIDGSVGMLVRLHPPVRNECVHGFHARRVIKLDGISTSGRRCVK